MRPHTARRQSGFVLLSLMVFLFVAALLALGDMRTLAVQQTLAASVFSAENTMVETESALTRMEEFAAYEGSELGRNYRNPPRGPVYMTPLLSNNTPICTNSTVSDQSQCTKESCYMYKYPKAATESNDDNRFGGWGVTTDRKLLKTSSGNLCSYCSPPTLNCKARWDEPPNPSATGNPWAEFTVNFYRNNDRDPRSDPPYTRPETDVYLTKKFWGMMEYLGRARCNLSDAFPNSTNLEAYTAFPTTVASEQARGCRVMRVTVRNQPSTARAPAITLQSTLLVMTNPENPTKASRNTLTNTNPCCYLPASVPAPASAISTGRFGYDPINGGNLIEAERISWRQIVPN